MAKNNQTTRLQRKNKGLLKTNREQKELIDLQDKTIVASIEKIDSRNKTITILTVVTIASLSLYLWGQ